MPENLHQANGIHPITLLLRCMSTPKGDGLPDKENTMNITIVSGDNSLTEQLHQKQKEENGGSIRVIELLSPSSDREDRNTETDSFHRVSISHQKVLSSETSHNLMGAIIRMRPDTIVFEYDSPTFTIEPQVWERLRRSGHNVIVFLPYNTPNQVMDFLKLSVNRPIAPLRQDNPLPHISSSISIHDGEKVGEWLLTDSTRDLLGTNADTEQVTQSLLRAS